MTAQDLKNAILQLAVQGKLVPQNPNDEPASELLKRIKAEKERLIKEGKIKREKPLSPISEDEIPFDIPESWEWVRLLEISSISSGGTPSRTNSSFWNGDIPWVKIGDISSKYVTRTEEMITEAGLNSSSANVFPKGTLLYTIFATIGTVGILDIDAATNQAVSGITFYGEYNLDYLYYILVGLKDLLVAKGKGMAQMNINQTILKNTPVPLPPLAEQQRIVAKIEELMPLVEEYGKAEERLTVLNAEFPDKLRKSILQQAIQGKLTERDPADEPASELLKRIRAKKERLIKEGKIKKEKPLPEIAETEIPFEIPDNWKWVRLGEIARVLGGKRIPAGRSLTQENTGHKYIRVSEMKNRTVITDGLLYVPEDIYSSISQYIIKKEDVYITVAGTIGRVGKIPAEIDGANLTENADRIVFSNLDQDWLILCLSSFEVQKQIELLTTSVAQPKLALKRIQEFRVPLPPLAEQKRIVDRLDKLLAVCDEMR